MVAEIKQIIKRNWLWGIYAVFVAIAIGTHEGEPLFFSDGPYAVGKPIVWLILLGFLAYSLKVSLQENFFKSLGRLHPILWSRQIGLDLYLGLLIPLTIIYLNEQSLLLLVLWFIPIFIFANLATLLYIALNYDSIIAHFVS